MAATTAPGSLSPPEGIGPLRRHRLRFSHLYFVCEGRPGGRDPEPLLRAALAGGAGPIQLRDRELPRGGLIRAGKTFRRLADTYGALFIVNDDPHLAIELGADGVHVGQDDMPPAKAREILGADSIIGLSTHSAAQIDAAAAEPVDYISVGPIWETPTKEGRPATGLELIAHARAATAHPWFAIGGIDTGNAGQVLDAGAERVCVVRAIRDAPDPGEATDALHAAVAAR